MDYHTGQVLIGSNEHERLPAGQSDQDDDLLRHRSRAQIRAHQAGRHGDHQLWNAWAKNYSDSSKMFIEVGKQVSVDNLNKGIIIQSGNDACIAMAEHIAGSEDSFASLMNRGPIVWG